MLLPVSGLFTAVGLVFTGAVKPPRSILPTKPNFHALSQLLCIWTASYASPPQKKNMWQQTHSFLIFLHMIMVSLDMVVVLWHRFIPELLAILQKFTLCLLSQKVQIIFVTFFVIEEHQIISRLILSKVNKAILSRTSYAITV